MKTIIRSIAIYTLALYFLPQIVPGLAIHGGFLTIIIGAVTLAFMFLILKPILNIISFPVNLLTLGLFSIVTNAFIIYLMTVVVTSITIEPFTYQRTEYWGFIIPEIPFNTFAAYAYTALILAAINSSIRWLVE